MKYLSICSGIEAATVAWKPLEWEAIAFSEIEPFCNTLLAYRYPDTPNLGDMKNYKEWNIGAIDIMVGGTPCQSFSIAGLRKGLDDPRGNLMLIYLAIARRYAPRWLVWENVPGVLSSNRGRDFGTFLGGLAELGYGFAYRILDAQFIRVESHSRAVPQRRRRVFIVGYLGKWQYPAAVLFERESLRGYPSPRREAGKRIAASLTRGADSSGKRGYAGRRCEDDTNVITQSLTARLGAGGPDDNKAQGGFYIAHPLLGKENSSHDESIETYIADDYANMSFAKSQIANPLTNSPDRSRAAPIISHAITAQKTASHRLDPSGETMIVFDRVQITSRENRARAQSGNPSPVLHGEAPLIAGTLPSDYHKSGGNGMGEMEGGVVAHSLQCRHDSSEDGTGRGMPIIGAFKPNQGAKSHSLGYAENLSPTVESASGGNNKPVVHINLAVRRLTPRECERLQGFPDDYTFIQYRGKPAKDGPRYRSLGNSMAVNVMRWIGERIKMMEEIIQDE